MLFRSRGLQLNREKQGRTAKLEEQHHDTLEADSTSGMGRRAEAECVDVRLHLLGVDPDGLHALLEQRGVVQPLGATEDLLAAHEKVVRVGERLSFRGI